MRIGVSLKKDLRALGCGNLEALVAFNFSGFGFGDLVVLAWFGDSVVAFSFSGCGFRDSVVLAWFGDLVVAFSIGGCGLHLNWWCWFGLGGVCGAVVVGL